MTILNLVFDETTAIVCSDTLVAGDREVSKLGVVPHLNAVLAVRGNVSALHFLMPGAMHCSSFDEFCDDLPNLLRLVMSEMDRQQQLLGRPPVHEELELAAVGWSDAQSSIRGEWYCCVDGEFTSVPMTSHARLAPGDVMDAPSIELDADFMLELSRRQIPLAQAKHGHDSCGGRIVVAQVDRESVSVSTHSC